MQTYVPASVPAFDAVRLAERERRAAHIGLARRRERCAHTCVAAHAGGHRHRQVRETVEDRVGDLAVAGARQEDTAGGISDAFGLSGAVEVVCRARADRDHADPLRDEGRGRGHLGRAVARIVTDRVSEPHDDARRAAAEAGRRVRGERLECVELALGGVPAASRNPGVHPRLDVRRVGCNRLVQPVGEGVDGVLVLADSELRRWLRGQHRRHDVGIARSDVGDRAAHAPGRVGEEEDVRVRRNRRRLDGLRDRLRRARKQRVGDRARCDSRRSERSAAERDRNRGDARCREQAPFQGAQLERPVMPLHVSPSLFVGSSSWDSRFERRHLRPR